MGEKEARKLERFGQEQRPAPESLQFQLARATTPVVMSPGLVGLATTCKSDLFGRLE